jgi:hypothetical protein
VHYAAHRMDSSFQRPLFWEDLKFSCERQVIVVKEGRTDHQQCAGCSFGCMQHEQWCASFSRCILSQKGVL